MWIFVVWAAFGAGWFLHALRTADSMATSGNPTTPSAAVISPDPAAGAPSATNSSRMAVTSGPAAAAESRVALSPEEARVQVFEVLGEPNRFIRMREVCRLLDGMTKENWREIKHAFLQQTVHTGRTYDAEWALMLHLVGQVARRRRWGPRKRSLIGSWWRRDLGKAIPRERSPA